MRCKIFSKDIVMIIDILFLEEVKDKGFNYINDLSKFSITLNNEEETFYPKTISKLDEMIEYDFSI